MIEVQMGLWSWVYLVYCVDYHLRCHDYRLSLSFRNLNGDRNSPILSNDPLLELFMQLNANGKYSYIRMYISIRHFLFTKCFLTPNGQAKEEITTRITLARNTFFWLTKPLCNYRETIKMKLYITTVCSILLYGCETRPIKVEDIKKLCLWPLMSKIFHRFIDRMKFTRLHLLSLR